MTVGHEGAAGVTRAPEHAHVPCEVLSACIRLAYASIMKAAACAGNETQRSGVLARGVHDAARDTKLVRLRGPSERTGAVVYAKVEMLNPGGSIKDRLAATVAESAGEGGLCEGTSGSTGVSLAVACASRGVPCHVYLPDDAAKEKHALLRALGANVHALRPVAITHPDHYVNAAKRRCAATGAGGVPPPTFVDQFETARNYRTHERTTAPELVRQLASLGHPHGVPQAFVCGCGTGGTMAGVSRHLARVAKAAGVPAPLCVVADPQGSALVHLVQRGVLYGDNDAEGRRVKHPMDTVVEGIGIGRLTANFAKRSACVTSALRVTDREAADAAHRLLVSDGLFVGSSSAVNVAAAERTAARLAKEARARRAPPPVVVTVLCDHGARHLSKFQNAVYMRQLGLHPAGARF